MTDALSIGWTQAQAATQRTVYRQWLGVDLAVRTVVGLIALIVPLWLAHQADLPGQPSPGWVRLWGVMMLITVVLYLPGWMEPLQARWPNMVGIVARFVLALAYVLLGRGFRWFALYELVFAIALAVSYSRLLRAALMARP